MAQFNLNVKHQQRYDTASVWTTKNPILLVGEIGIESDTGKLKVGNGLSAWSSLSYVGITLEYLQANYLPKYNPVINGAVQLTDSNSQITRNTVSPRNNNIGVNGVMITHYNGDEGGLLINEDGAYLWNSTDSGFALKVLDEDVWAANAGAKKDCDFSNGLLFNIDNMGNVKCKGKFYHTNGLTEPGAVSSLPASSITVTANSNLGGYTNLQSVLNYIANVFAGTQAVTKLKATAFDAVGG